MEKNRMFSELVDFLLGREGLKKKIAKIEKDYNQAVSTVLSQQEEINRNWTKISSQEEEIIEFKKNFIQAGVNVTEERIIYDKEIKALKADLNKARNQITFKDIEIDRLKLKVASRSEN